MSRTIAPVTAEEHPGGVTTGRLVTVTYTAALEYKQVIGDPPNFVPSVLGPPPDWYITTMTHPGHRAKGPKVPDVAEQNRAETVPERRRQAGDGVVP